MIVFEPKEHRYFNQETKDEYISVSGVLSQFKPEFDTEKWAKRVADKEGTTPENIIKKWDRIRDEANDKGKRIHKLVEIYLTEGKYDDSLFFRNFMTTFQAECEENSIVHSERILHTHTHKVAGTSDIIEDCGRYFNVYDIKTNKKFKYHSPFNEKMLYPLEHLSVCEYNSYTLQLSLYAYMYSQMTGKHVGKLRVFYNHDKDFWVSIPMGYMKDSVEKMLNLIKR